MEIAVPAKSFVVLYDNELGTGRPLAATFVESDGTANTIANSYAQFYSDSVNAIAGSWGVIIPNNNALGVRRIEARNLSGTLFPNPATSANGLWGTVNTVNPAFGLTAAMIPPELAPLPVELASFTANVSVGLVTLNWMTATELNNRAFEVERKTTGDWAKIGEVAGNGTTTSSTFYSFEDRTLLNGKVSYRLKQIDLDGSFSYSNPIDVVINSNVVEGESNPTVYNLEQNYPNPFNPSTVIRFAIPVAGEVSLSVYNTLGQKVAQLLNSTMPAGYHQVEFNANDIPSGLYMYEVKAGEFTSTKKMLLLK
ncbi:MAG: T9SS type A sorting domain-containing protein [Ignavibacteriales bacterium]|nr:T9SS type A sorting domain-containing protein [Ignavibacteriales bacterium]